MTDTERAREFMVGFMSGMPELVTDADVEKVSAAFRAVREEERERCYRIALSARTTTAESLGVFKDAGLDTEDEATSALFRLLVGLVNDEAQTTAAAIRKGAER